MKIFMTKLILFTILGLVNTTDSKISLIGKNKGQILAKILRHLEESGDKKIFTDQREVWKENLELGRRNAVQLASMVKHTTGTNPAKYFNYGCYCGYSGKGRTVDEIDKCCQTHDRCYGKLTDDHGCNKWWRYVNTYSWKKEKNGKIICESVNDVCKDGQCLCDKQMAKCFQEHHKVYNNDYTGWWWMLFNDC